MYAASASPSWVAIAPQQDAYVVVAKSHCQSSGGSAVQALEISLPGSSTVSTLRLPSGFGSLVYCPDQQGQVSSSSALQMSPISASVAAAAGA